jgi:hypothetical protein
MSNLVKVIYIARELLIGWNIYSFDDLRASNLCLDIIALGYDTKERVISIQRKGK